MPESTQNERPIALGALARLTAAVRVPLLRLGVWVATLGVVGSFLPLPVLLMPSLWTAAAGAALLLLAVAANALSPKAAVPAIVVEPPVRGRWVAIDSPRLIVPSRGTHRLGQTYALTLAAEPEDAPRPRFNDPSGGFLELSKFPGFGEPVFAMAGGVVVRASDAQRDHRSRSRLGAVLFMNILEGLVRALGPAARTIGNHLVVQLPDGTHLLYAHLRQGSIQPAVGDTVRAGDVIAGCGNSGSSAEPQLQIQRQDVASPLTATGLPWAVAGLGAGGEAGFPRTREPFTVEEPAGSSAA